MIQFSAYTKLQLRLLVYPTLFWLENCLRGNENSRRLVFFSKMFFFSKSFSKFPVYSHPIPRYLDSHWMNGRVLNLWINACIKYRCIFFIFFMSIAYFQLRGDKISLGLIAGIFISTASGEEPKKMISCVSNVFIYFSIRQNMLTNEQSRPLRSLR